MEPTHYISPLGLVLSRNMHTHVRVRSVHGYCHMPERIEDVFCTGRTSFSSTIPSFACAVRTVFFLQKARNCCCTGGTCSSCTRTKKNRHVVLVCARIQTGFPVEVPINWVSSDRTAWVNVESHLDNCAWRASGSGNSKNHLLHWLKS